MLNRIRKGQMEIMGLAIIVVFISLAMLFVIQFIVLKPVEDTRSEYVRTQVASNIVSAMLKADSGCKDTSFTELIQDCVVWKGVGGLECYGKNSCQYLEDGVFMILNSTLGKWGRKYDFRVYKQANVADNLVRVNRSSCKYERETKIYPVPTDAGPVIVRIDVC